MPIAGGGPGNKADPAREPRSRRRPQPRSRRRAPRRLRARGGRRAGPCGCGPWIRGRGPAAAPLSGRLTQIGALRPSAYGEVLSESLRHSDIDRGHSIYPGEEGRLACAAQRARPFGRLRRAEVLWLLSEVGATQVQAEVTQMYVSHSDTDSGTRVRTPGLGYGLRETRIRTPGPLRYTEASAKRRQTRAHESGSDVDISGRTEVLDTPGLG